MDVNQFLLTLLKELAKLNFVKKVDLETEVCILKGKAILELDHFLQIYYNAETGTTAISLVKNEMRIWGIDFDNIRGWHVHPFGESDIHKSVDHQNVNEIVNELKKIWLKIS